MSYINVAKRYDSPPSAGVTEQLANLDKTMRRYEGAFNTPSPVNRKRAAEESLESFRHKHALPPKPPPSAAADYGFERGRRPGGAVEWNQAGSRGSRDHYGYQQYQEQQSYPTCTAEEAYRQQQRWQRSAHPDFRQGSYSNWQQPGRQYLNVYPTAPPQEAWQYQQYALSFPHFLSHQVAQQAQSNRQHGLTRLWQSAHNAGSQSTAQLNAKATAFQPQAPPVRSVPFEELTQISGVDKAFRYADYKSTSTCPSYDRGGVSLQQRSPVTGYNKANTTSLNGTTAQRTGPAASPRAITGRIRVPWAQRNIPRKHMMEKPNPTAEYLKQASNAPEEVSSPKSFLVILDLNGTLLYRPRKGGSKYLERPHLNKFLRYLLQNHFVMVWSSSKPKNVQGMTTKLFDEASKEKLIATWNRTHLRLPEEAYEQKVQVYKQLSWVWEDQTMQLKHPDRAAQTDPTASWSQADTVLIDDSILKAASEPHNLIELEEFEATGVQMKEDVLGPVVVYLEKLRMQKDVSAYMRAKPFAFDREASVDWAPFIENNEA